MRKIWDKFAEKDAKFYIDTHNPKSYFWKKGENDFKNYLLPLIKKYKIHKDVALDFGCGLGRHIFPMATIFKKVYGVDISLKMIGLAKIEKEKKRMRNIEFYTNKQFMRFIQNKKVDFIYSQNVFQHMELNEIDKYIKFFNKILKGYAYLHFDTRKKDLIYNIKMLLADRLLLEKQRHGFKRIRQNYNDIKKILMKYRFKIINANNPGEDCCYVLAKK